MPHDGDGSPKVPDHVTPAEALSPGDDLAVLKAFHGHLGPYVFAGMRLGRYAVARLEADPHFGIEADVYCPGRTPVSCSIDGIQISTGCTLGKMNIRHHEADDGVTVRFLNRNTGKAMRFAVRQEPLERAVAVMREHGDQAGARVLMDVPDEELIEELPEG